jgi:hypothetical protein
MTQLGIALLADLRVDRFNKFALRVTGVAHVDGVVVAAVFRPAVAG